MTQPTLPNLFRIFFVIGSSSFGGYMALIAMVRKQMVEKLGVIDDQRIAEGITIASILPGPIAVNVVGYVGFMLAGLRGAITSIVAVLLPSFFIVLLLSFLYFQFQQEINLGAVMMGIMPVVVAIVAGVGISMAKKALVSWQHYLIAIASFLIAFMLKSYWAIIIIIVMSLALGLLLYGSNKRQTKTGTKENWWPVVVLMAAFAGVLVMLSFSNHVLADLFTQFASVSLTLLGGGYVMVPILQDLLVNTRAWVTEQEFVYGISVGQVTPGPILISSVFFGYKMSGVVGAIVATVAIFFPSGMLMILVAKLFLRYDLKSILEPAFKAVRPAVVGLVFYSAFSIFRDSVSASTLIVSLVIFAVALAATLRFNASPVILVLAGGLLGILINYFKL